MTTETRTRLPEFLRPLFWDVASHTLSPERHQSFVCLRLIEHGDLDALRWMVGYKVRAAWGVADHRHDSGRHAHRLGRAHQSQPFRLPIPARRAACCLGSLWDATGFPRGFGLHETHRHPAVRAETRLHRLLQDIPLERAVALYTQKYGATAGGSLFYALTYFVDADAEPTPRLRTHLS